MTQAPPQEILFNQQKAGLNVNAKEISAKITEVSKNTKFFEFQKKRTHDINGQTGVLHEKLSTSSSMEKEMAKLKADAMISSYESKQNFDTILFHADLDAFFASVEALDDPSLVGVPFAVGGSVRHGVISTSSYEARKFGVRAGMAVFIALSLCPELRIVGHHGNRYCELSAMVKNVFARYDPNYTSWGLDEATLNVTDYLKEHPEYTPIDLANKIKEEVTQETKLTISIGIGPNHQLSKMASDMRKPNGVFQMPTNQTELREFLASLTIRKIPGIGGVTETKLHSLGIETLADVYKKRAEISLLFSDKFCKFIFSSLVGVQYDRSTDSPQQSISKESTFDATNDINFLMDLVEEMALKLANKLDRGQIACKTITLKYKTVNFQIFNKSITLDQHTRQSRDIVNAAIKLLLEEHRNEHLTLRLIGVKVNNLSYPGQKRQKAITNFVVKGKEACDQINFQTQQIVKHETTTKTTSKAPSGIACFVVKGKEAEEHIQTQQQQLVQHPKSPKSPPSPKTQKNEHKTKHGTKRISTFFVPPGKIKVIDLQ